MVALTTIARSGGATIIASLRSTRPAHAVSTQRLLIPLIETK
jgi:hypothetical protein